MLGLTTGYCPKKKEKTQMAARIDLKDAIKGNALPTGRGIKVLQIGLALVAIVFAFSAAVAPVRLTRLAPAKRCITRGRP